MESVQFESKNYEYLTSQILPPLGFSGVLDDKLKQRMTTAANLQLKEINLSVFSKKYKTQYDLKFDKSKEGGPYFFLNKIKATLSIPGQKEGDYTSRSHTFTLYNQQGFNAKQIKNLLRGGAVRELRKNKNQKLARWRRLDLTQKNEQDNFVEKKPYYESDLNVDYVRLLSDLPVHGSAEDKEKLLRDIFDGELVKAYATVGKERQEVYLEATPHLGDKLTVYNQHMKKIHISTSGIEQSMEVIPETIEQSLQEGQQQGASADDAQQPGAEQTIQPEGENNATEQQITNIPTGDATPPNQEQSTDQRPEANPTSELNTNPAANELTTDPAQVAGNGVTSPTGGTDDPPPGERLPAQSQVEPNHENDLGKKEPFLSPSTSALLEGPDKKKGQKADKKIRP